MAVRIALADGSFLAREALSGMLADIPEVKLVATCCNADELRAAVDAAGPDLVLTEVRLAAELRHLHPELAVIAVGDEADSQHARALFESGADGLAYLLERDLQRPGALRAAIDTVTRGGSLIDMKVVEGLLRRSPVAGLSAAERATLVEMARGASNAAIAGTLGITQRAVERHIHAIFEKLDVPATPDVNRRVRAVLLFLAAAGSDRRDVPV